MGIYSKILFFCEIYLLSMFMYFIILAKKRKNKFEFKNSIDLSFIIERYKLNVSKLPYNLFVSVVNVSNSFMLALTVTLMLMVKKYIYKLLFGFVIIFILIYIIYDFIGKYFKKREERYV